MTNTAKPSVRPACPNFSSGPANKHPGWTVDALKGAPIGRSHRSTLCKSKLKQVIDETKALLGLPENYHVGIMAASDTGAVEAAMWSMLGPRPVDVFAWENFGKDWVTDCLKELKPLEVRSFVAEYGELPKLNESNPDHDIIFTWNGTTSGVIVPNGDWIKADRKGLTICDATSSACAVPMPFEKLDVITFSWQKILGGEAQHGILILSPRAVERLETHKPSWPVPKIFRLTKDGKFNKGIFEGETINTPSMICVEDALDAMKWARSVGGAAGLQKRTIANARAFDEWVSTSKTFGYLCPHENLRSPTSVCLKLTDPAVTALSTDDQKAFCKKLVGLVEKEGVAYDFNAYAVAPPGLRIWCGATVETDDVKKLTPWIDWAYEICKAELKAAA